MNVQAASEPLTLCTLSDLAPLQYGNIVVQVLGAFVTGRGSYVLRVWDGTRFPTPTLCIDAERECAPGGYLRSGAAPRYVNRVTRAALAFDVFLYGEFRRELDTFAPGSFVLLQNVHALVHRGATCGEVSLTMHDHNPNNPHERSVTLLTQDHPAVQPLMRKLESKLKELDEN